MPSNIGTVGLSLRWEPWDWGRKHHEYDEKRTKEEQAKVGVDATERAVLLEVRNACRQLENTRRQLTLSDASERAARQKLKEVQEQVKTRSGIEQRFVSSTVGIWLPPTASSNKLCTAFWKARADLKKAIGEE